MNLDDLINALPDVSAPAKGGSSVDALIAALPDLTSGISQGRAALIGVGAGLDRMASSLRAAVPDPVRSAIDSLGSALGMGAPPSIDQTQQTANAGALKPLEQKFPVTMALSEGAPTMAAKTPLGMAALGAMDSYGDLTNRAQDAAGAFVGGKIGQGIGRLFGPSSMSAAGAANPYGIPLRMAQTTDSKPIQIMDAVAANLPVSSGVIAKAKDASYGAFNRAVAKTFGKDTSQITPDILGDALDRSGNQIGDIMQRARAQLSPAHAQQVADLSSDIADIGPDAAPLAARLSQLVDTTTNGQGLSGQALRKFDSSLGRIVGTSQNGDVRYAAASLQNILRDAASQSLSPADNAALTAARAQNFNVRQVADAMKATPDALSPTQLLQSVNRAQRASRYGGGNDLAELARWAKGTMPDAVPNSGTAQREWYQKILTNPLTTIGSVGGALYGANEVGISPEDATIGLLGPYLAARAMAGKPASALAKQLLTRTGGLLGYETAQ